ncbi:MAG: Gfo/Idh/MocA family oxidoreductase, partial [Phycisphaeraceae bacterium]
MNGQQNIRWLLVGTGEIVRKRVAEALRSAEGSTLAGVVGGLDRAQAIAREFGGQAYGELDEALRRCEADAVYIATPVHRHKSEALKAIAAGKPVLIEKPLGLDGQDAQTIADAAERAGVTAGCAYYRRLFPRYQQLRQQIDAGELGPLTLVRSTYHAWFVPAADDPKRWRVDPALSGGGPLADMGSHMIDLIVGLFGVPETVFGLTDTLVQDYAVEDSSAAVLRLTNGAQVLLSFGWNSKTWVHEFEVVGREARVRWCPADAGKVVTTIGRDVQEADLPNAENVHTPLVADFVAALREGRAPACPVSDAMQTNRVLDAIYQSGRAGQAITLQKAA